MRVCQFRHDGKWTYSSRQPESRRIRKTCIPILQTRSPRPNKPAIKPTVGMPHLSPMLRDIGTRTSKPEIDFDQNSLQFSVAFLSALSVLGFLRRERPNLTP